MNIKLAWTKRRLKGAYLSYMHVLDQYSCGANLAEFISPGLSGLKYEINKWIDRVNELDPGAVLNHLE
jgi:hypothetical protein